MLRFWFIVSIIVCKFQCSFFIWGTSSALTGVGVPEDLLKCNGTLFLAMSALWAGENEVIHISTHTATSRRNIFADFSILRHEQLHDAILWMPGRWWERHWRYMDFECSQLYRSNTCTSWNPYISVLSKPLNASTISLGYSSNQAVSYNGMDLHQAAYETKYSTLVLFL